jgi:hypothetical protein
VSVRVCKQRRAREETTKAGAIGKESEAVQVCACVWAETRSRQDGRRGGEAPEAQSRSKGGLRAQRRERERRWAGLVESGEWARECDERVGETERGDLKRTGQREAVVWWVGRCEIGMDGRVRVRVRVCWNERAREMDGMSAQRHKVGNEARAR